MTYTGYDLIKWGFEPGEGFGAMIDRANLLSDAGMSSLRIIDELKTIAPPPKILWRNRAHFFETLALARTEEEQANATKVWEDMHAVMRNPMVTDGILMPDACPAGALPVGGVAYTRNTIHPGYHSADICCSMTLSLCPGYWNDDHQQSHYLATAMRAAMDITHFGPIERGAPPNAKIIERSMGTIWSARRGDSGATVSSRLTSAINAESPRPKPRFLSAINCPFRFYAATRVWLPSISLARSR